MKLVRTTLLIATFILSACTTRAGQELGTKYQTSSYRRSQTKTLPSEHLPASYLARSVWGGFHLNLAMIGAASPSSSALFSSVTFSSSPSSPAQTCDSTEDFCILQHRFPFQRPFSPTFNTAIELSYLYGSTQFGDLAPHHGVEILNPTGTPVLAVGDGTVVVAGSDAHNTYGPWEDFYGNLVVLGHSLPGIEKPVFTLYGHLSEIAVQVGDTVKAGELIGEVGATGRAIGSHLHFEVRVGANRYENTRNPALC